MKTCIYLFKKPTGQGIQLLLNSFENLIHKIYRNLTKKAYKQKIDFFVVFGVN